jgi:hypothetical protein
VSAKIAADVAAPTNTRELVDRLLADAEIVRIRVDGVDDESPSA